jgi:acetolactate synthase-1/2/3 large subunit
MVKMTQQMAFKPVKTMLKKSLDPEEMINTELGEVEWNIVGRAMGAFGERVSDPEGLKNALAKALESGQPAVIHCDVDPVKHMWAPGLLLFKKMHQEPGG